ncbi:MAG: MAPEG family protein, partial [Bdellovibrionota bacterium]|nr:MAPEG family protein [Bdellovibrionota bacterium]
RLRRGQAVKKGLVRSRFFKTFEGEPPPRDVIAADQLILNLFEMPVLFFTVSLIIIALKINDNVQMILASLYVISRFWHAYIKIQNGRLAIRALVFTISAVMLTGMWVWLMIQAFFP